MTTTAQYGVAIYGDSLYGAITMSASGGAYSLTGGNATLLHGRVINTVKGDYSLTGEDASLLQTSILNADAGGYTLTGVSAGGIYDQVVFAGNGAYNLTGSDAEFAYTQILYANSGSYTLTGSNASLVYVQPNQQVQTTGGVSKKPVKKTQTNEIESIVRKAFNKLEGIDDDIIEEVKSEVKQDIQQIDLTNYDLALSQVRLLVLMAETRIKMLDELRAEDEDEAALLMLL